MQLNADEEDEKQHDPFSFDQRVYEFTRKVLEQKSEDLLKAMSTGFIDHVLGSEVLQGVSSAGLTGAL